MRRLTRRSQRGFSLLEMVVAVAILGAALGALYQAAGGATRNVRSDQRYAYAVELARSLLADSSEVPLEGLQNRGETSGGFRWELQTEALQRSRGSSFSGGRLQRTTVTVAWSDGPRERRVLLDSVVVGVAR